MKKLVVERIAVIPASDTRKEFVSIKFRGLDKEWNLGRSPKQLLMDLKDSHLLDEEVDSIHDTEVLALMRGITGGWCEGEIQHYKAGSTYKVGETDQVIINPSHPQYGKVVVGQEIPVEKNGTRVSDGFLTFTRSAMVESMYIDAEVTAKKKLRLQGFLQAAAKASSNGEKTEDFKTEEHLRNEVVGN